MLDTLQKIIAHKQNVEIPASQAQRNTTDLEAMPHFGRKTHSLSERLREGIGHGLIAEFKRRSPSKPDIRLGAEVASVAAGYARAGVAGISVLTDETFFGGSLHDLAQARETVSVPLLRKDFVVDAYQVMEAKAFGADVVLLIAAVLSPAQAQELTATAQELGLEVLLEIHQAEDMDIYRAAPTVDIIGINNRNLRTFAVDLEHSRSLAQSLPQDKPRISESGLNDPRTVRALQSDGFMGFLIGEYFMRQPDPGLACQKFINFLSNDFS
ncbi:MAG: indole-3-glycerol-phosphate synthase [Bernardetiaceae bacterium]